METEDEACGLGKLVRLFRSDVDNGALRAAAARRVTVPIVCVGGVLFVQLRGGWIDDAGGPFKSGCSGLSRGFATGRFLSVPEPIPFGV